MSVYSAHVRIGGKLFREFLWTTDRKLADRKLADFRRSQGRAELRVGKITQAELTDRYSKTIAHLGPSTCHGKEGILLQLKAD